MVPAHSVDRINEVLIFIDRNLDSDLPLDTIARIGCYSPFHLHRLFKTVTGETLNNYITRKRIEKIAGCLMFRKDIAVAELAAKYGFSSNATLTRAFTKYYGVSPTRFRHMLPGEYSKIGKTDSKNGEVPAIFDQYICDIKNCLNNMNKNAKIEVKQLPAMHIAYTTCIGVGELERSFEKMMQWARKARLMEQPDFKMVRIFHDSFRITAPDRVRMSIGTPAPPDAETGDTIGITTMLKGKYIVASMLIAPPDFGKAWESLFVWMNENGYKKAPGDPYELIYNNYNTHPEGKSQVDMCIPIL
jgi:AraC family transcriptional regulator